MEAALEELDSLGVDVDDIPTWLELELDAWKLTERPSRQLTAVVAAYIEAGEDDLAASLAQKYFELHGRLATEPLLGHDGASALLSHARLIALLALEEHLSAAQIANLVVARDSRTPVTWRHIDAILARVGGRPSLSVTDVEGVFEMDRALELEVFADAEEDVCIEMVAGAGRRLGFPGDLMGAARTLLPANAVPKGPYLQMLHFQCLLAEFYDHDLSAIYEFNPRGEASEWLFARYPDSLDVSGNPFLNNAKGVDRLGEDWANSKKAARKAEAYALVQLIDGLDSMGFASRRELAAWIRRLLVRRIRLASGASTTLPDSLSPEEVSRLLVAVCTEETNTRGILEQRLMDAACSLRNPPPDWISRGLMDSVNATNTSRKKCGDCDFQDSAAREVVAYEAHGGRLTDLYIDAHLRTLAKILSEREKEWKENVGPDLSWKVKVIFVAHSMDLTATRAPAPIGNVEIAIETITFADLLEDMNPADSQTLAAFEAYVLSPLSRPRTPDLIRRRLLDLISG